MQAYKNSGDKYPNFMADSVIWMAADSKVNRV